MTRKATKIFGALLLACLAAAPALATQYPPGPGGACPDTLSIYQVQNPAAPCHPVSGDTLLGIGGIVTGLDQIPTGFSYYIQTTGGSPWTGLNVFTGGSNMSSTLGYQLGDSVKVYWSSKTVFSGGIEVQSPNANFSSPNIIISGRLTTGNPLPPFHVGTVTELRKDVANVAAPQWDCMLVQVPGPMRVVRTSLTGGMSFNNFFVVDNVACPPSAVGPCDSMAVDGATLTTYAPPAVGVLVDNVQGVFDSRGSGAAQTWRIQLRSGDDIVVATPPNVTDAYAVALDTVRVTFDRSVTQATAEDVANYTLASFGTVLSATLESSAKAVDVAINNGLNAGDNEAVTVSGIAGAANGLVMTGSQTFAFYNGVLSVHDIRIPDPAGLAANPCVDRSRFDGVGSVPGQRLTFKGICTAGYGNLFPIQDPSSAQRTGMLMFAPITALTPGHQYLIAGAMQYYFGEQEGTNNSYIRDLGPATLPDPVVQTIHVLTDTTCDATQSITNGWDYLSQLVTLYYVKATSNENAGVGFLVAGPNGAYSDTMFITNTGGNMWTYQADSDMVMNVTGVLRYDSRYFTNFRVAPRSNADFIDHGINVGVGPTAIDRVSFSVYPNPARAATVAFALPRRDNVELAVFDLAGRQVATLASGSYAPGLHTKEWNGRDAAGNLMGSGVYFMRLRVGSVVYSLRSVRLN